MTSREYFDWDIFLAHAGPDISQAEALYDLLQPHARVFLDSRSLQLGDNWDESLARAQSRSAITVVLVSSRTTQAYYQREEIAAAISMARRGKDLHKVVPLYLDPDASSDDSIPYGLRTKVGITVARNGDMVGAAQNLLTLLGQVNEHETEIHAPAPYPPESRNIEYYCYISCSKVDQLIREIELNSQNSAARSPEIPARVKHPNRDFNDLVTSAVSFGRPDLYQRDAKKKRHCAKRLQELLHVVAPSVRKFCWRDESDVHALYQFSRRFHVTEINDDDLMVTIVSKYDESELILHCSLLNFSHTTIYRGKPCFQSTNYGFFKEYNPVFFETLFLLTSVVGQKFVGSPIYLKLPITSGVSL